MAEGRFGATLKARRITLGEALTRYLREVVPGKKGAGQEAGRWCWCGRTSPTPRRAIARLRSPVRRGILRLPATPLPL